MQPVAHVPRNLADDRSIVVKRSDDTAVGVHVGHDDGGRTYVGQARAQELQVDAAFFLSPHDVSDAATARYHVGDPIALRAVSQDKNDGTRR